MQEFYKNDIIYIFKNIFEGLDIDIYLVGGAVRDILMGIEPYDFDFVCEIDEEKHYITAKKISELLKCRFKYNNYYHTAKFFYNGYEIDFVMARSEKYPDIASKPVINSSDIENDLKRRDFTINSIALSLKKDNINIIDPFKGIDDIKNKKLRILHKNSFRDDPSRIFRGIKYASRFNFEFECETEKSIINACERKYFSYLKGVRLRNELENILNDENPLAAVFLIGNYKILESIINSGIIINTDLNKIKFKNLDFNDKLISLFYKCDIDTINKIMNAFKLGRRFTDNIIKIKNIENIILNNDYNVYRYLFENNININDKLLDILFGFDNRVMNYIIYKDLIKIDFGLIKDIKEEERKNYIASKKAEMIIKIVNGG